MLRDELSMTGKLDWMPLVYFSLNVFIMGREIEGKRFLGSFRNSVPKFTILFSAFSILR